MAMALYSLQTYPSKDLQLEFKFVQVALVRS